LPGLSGFVPEYLVLMGTWTVSGPLALFAVLGVVIAALYVLMPYQRVFTGAPGKGKEDLADLTERERGVMVPLVAAMLILGIWSAPLVSALTPVASDLDLTNSQVGAVAEGSAQ
ncbi:MAG: NADH-quinone oxidoreductase subunit M, partial [Actinomyces sp.]